MSEEQNKSQSAPEVSNADSKEICEELRAILENVQLNSFLLSNAEDREIIAKKSKKLSFDERAKLLDKLYSNYPGWIMFDAGDFFSAKITIDDKDSDASENRPLAYIEFSDYYNSRVEVIDILESVRNDATAIGHPVILYAIHHWQKILVWEKYNKEDNVYSEENEWMDYLVSGQYIESARKNLEAIGKAMFEAVRRQAIPKEYALNLKIKNLKLEENNTYLFIAWERLASKHINQTHGLIERISEIEYYLEQLPTTHSFKMLYDYPVELQKYGYVETSIRSSAVIDFLKADGSKFVYDENNHNCLRPRWTVFKNAFLKWYYQKEGTTIEKYKNIAKAQEIDEEPYSSGFLWTSARPIRLSSWLYQIWTKPLVKFCEPIECSTEVANSRRFAKLINQDKTK